MEQSHYGATWDGLTHTIYKLLDHFYLKVFFSYLALFLSWMFNGKTEIIYIILILFIIDAISGTFAALKNKEFSSRGIFRTPIKFLVYFSMLGVSRLADRVLPVPILSPVMDTFLVITESVSILENVYKLGFPVPLFLVKKLKAYTEKK